MSRARAAILLILLPALAGCFTEANTRTTLSDAVRLTAIDEDAAVSSRDVEPAPGTLDVYRRAWDTTYFVVPVDATDHLYLGRTDMVRTDSTARQRRLYPTPTSAIELGGDSADTQIYEAFEGPVWAAFDAVLLIPRYIAWAVYNRADAVSPDIDYQRAPARELTPAQRRVWLGEGATPSTPEPTGDTTASIR